MDYSQQPSNWPGTTFEYQWAYLRATNPKLNDKECAIRAGWSKSSAPAKAKATKRKAYVRVWMDAFTEEQAARTNVSGDRVVEELAAIAFARVADLWGMGLKMADKVNALNLLGKHFGIYAPEQIGLTEDTIDKLAQVLRKYSDTDIIEIERKMDDQDASDEDNE